MFIKEYELRWNDIDANMHLANSSYLMLFSQTRMAFLESLGLNMKALLMKGIGPVVFRESIHYFKEVRPGHPVHVSLEVKGLAEDGRFFEFEHNLYNHKGQNCARSPIFGAWIDQKTRKTTGLPSEWLDLLDEHKVSEGFKVLSPADTRIEHIVPTDIQL